MSAKIWSFIFTFLEKQAFKHVVCALRAQGPLSQYREVILDHLKAIFLYVAINI